jgi:3-keto-disaccharide hydrolase
MKTKQLVIILLAQLIVRAGLAQADPNSSHASGSILFQDDFSKPADGWMAAKTDYAQFAYLDGEYRILLNKPDFNTYSLLPKQSFDNFSVEVDVRLATGPANGVFGVLCRAEANQQTVQKAYVFAIRTDGFYAILKRTSPTFWDAIAYGKESKAIKSGSAVNHLRADCSGTTLTLYVNGEKLLEKTDADFKAGQVGFAVTTQPKSEPLDVRFDNFVVRGTAP